MIISAYVRRVQRHLVIATISNGVAAAASAVLVVLAAAAFMNRSYAVGTVVAVFAAALLLGIITWKSRALGYRSRVALWIEEVVPSLDYALVTSLEAESELADLEKSVRVEAIHPLVRARLVRTTWRSLLLLAGASTVYLVSPATSLGRGRVQSALGKAFPRVVRSTDKLASIQIRIIPPLYSGQRTVEMRDVTSLSALAGSRIVLTGRGSPDGVVITVDNAPLKTTGDDSEWSASVTANKAVSVLRARYMTKSRLIIVETTPDKPPRVVLTLPLRDTTLRIPRYSGQLHAEAGDDFQVTDGYFEYLIVSGSGEAFNGRTLTSAPFRFNSRTGRLQADLNFAALKVGAGDVVSVRAIVRDNNTLSGPSIGTSDTRTFRVARADEYDSVSIEAAAPPPVDSSAMSQRMLILMTEALVKKQKSLTHKQFVKESDDIATIEDRIRKRVYDIIYQTDSPEGAGDTEEAESGIQANDNPDLKQAYDALWDAVRSLRIAEPAVALPPMRKALKALDRARLAQRLYLRGASPKLVIDVERVRMIGKEKGASSLRTQQAAVDSLRRALVSGFESALAIRTVNRQLAIEQLSLLRIRALEGAPEFAAAVRDAVELLQTNRNAGPALIRARRALGALRSGTPLSVEWGGG